MTSRRWVPRRGAAFLPALHKPSVHGAGTASPTAPLPGLDPHLPPPSCETSKERAAWTTRDAKLAPAFKQINWKKYQESLFRP